MLLGLTCLRLLRPILRPLGGLLPAVLSAPLRGGLLFRPRLLLLLL